MGRRNGTTAIFLIVTSFLYQSSLASLCNRYGLSFLSKSYSDQWLTSPSYPYNYPPYSNCLWSLQRPSSVYAVRLTFNFFSLESKTSCTDDYVEIRDGDLHSTSKLIGKFCGSRLPPRIVSNYKYIFIKFVSDSDYYPVMRKFSATFRAVLPVRTPASAHRTVHFSTTTTYS
ncbi:Bone morphogenetic protein 1 [Desmophyllum pertusum]|uniref:Bone morphogenetic protein 1 n=1 Tax=Desmophyllum pertusum TaxID=174260 RepID=A0A9X0CPL3_9CNID|nr:Bone morphogenetic protein 1 [Desmophyllum pertusum]